MKKVLTKKAASIALSMAIAGSSQIAMSTPVYADDEATNLKQAEQSADEEQEEKQEEENVTRENKKSFNYKTLFLCKKISNV